MPANDTSQALLELGAVERGGSHLLPKPPRLAEIAEEERPSATEVGAEDQDFDDAYASGHFTVQSSQDHVSLMLLMSTDPV